MPNKYTTLAQLFKAVADAIRVKKGGAADIIADNFPDEITSIQTSKPETTFSATPTTSAQTITPPAGKVFSGGTVNAMQTGVLAIPTVDSNGLVSANVQTSGYLAFGTSKTLQLATQAAQTITPSTSDKTIPSGKYITGVQTIKGDVNLLAANIKNGLSIFGVTGSMNSAPTAASASVNMGSVTACQLIGNTVAINTYYSGVQFTITVTLT